LRVQGGLALGRQVGSTSVGGCYPVTPALLPSHGGQDGPVLARRLPGQAYRRPFGAKSRISPAQRRPDLVTPGAAHGLVLVLNYLDPAIPDFVQRELELKLSPDPGRCVWLRAGEGRLSQDAPDRRIHQPGHTATERTTIGSRSQHRLDDHSFRCGFVPDD
jgi:hypothetical protein